MKLQNRVIVVAKLIAAGMLLGALGRHAYDYYVLLRWVVCGVGGLGAFRASEVGKKGWAWALGIVALFFNPIMPVHLTRQTWGFIDVGAALLLLVSIVAVDLRPPSTPSSNAGTIPPGQREEDL
jgi:hypothetical protein